ncbi:hypothetical protein GCM10007147_39320 [Nocardiopsis kunsanensis]|uniref:Probable multidrug resistance protein NorM n=2 Tax=Nocardiopsis kunsanensis TaxID=141693 RepID=A0A919CKS7_9ACTN|nr:hypothetical protein GCM10007147_39320 [Nocardiopsis kunsanensis]
MQVAVMGVEERETQGIKISSRSFGILKKALPLYFSMVASFSGALVSAGVLGNLLTEALAAHALVTALLAPTIMVVQGSLRGSMPFIAENEDNSAALATVIRDGIWLALLMGATAGLFIFSTPMLAAIVGVTDSTRSALGFYPLFIGCHAVTVSLSASATVLLVALGRNRTVLMLGLVHTLLSLTLVPTLVLGLGPLPGMALAGAGLATLLGSTITLALTWFTVRRIPVLGKVSVLSGIPRLAGMWKIAKVGLPTGSTLLIKSVSLSVLIVAVTRIGAEAAAAHQFLILFANLLFFPSLSVGQSTVPYIAKAAKRRDQSEVRRTVLSGYSVAVPLTLVSAVALWSVVDPALSVLTHDFEVRTMVATLLPLVFLVALFDSVQVVSGMGLVALKQTTPAMYTFLIFYGLLVLLTFPLVSVGGLPLLWSAYAVTTFGLLIGQGGAFLRTSAKV